jgi:hypothetical protein
MEMDVGRWIDNDDESAGWALARYVADPHVSTTRRFHCRVANNLDRYVHGQWARSAARHRGPDSPEIDDEGASRAGARPPRFALVE